MTPTMCVLSCQPRVLRKQYRNVLIRIRTRKQLAPFIYCKVADDDETGLWLDK